MRCIYFTGETCLAKPENNSLVYKPTPEERTGLCENGEEFGGCPRLQAYIQHLEAFNGTKRK